MAELIDVAVVSVGPLSPTKYETSAPFHKVVFKKLKDGKSITLNLQKKPGKSGNDNYTSWMKNLIPGKVLTVGLQETGKNVDQFHVFKALTEVQKKTSDNKEVTKETVGDDIIAIQFERINKAVSVIEDATRIINEEISRK